MVGHTAYCMPASGPEQMAVRAAVPKVERTAYHLGLSPSSPCQPSNN